VKAVSNLKDTAQKIQDKLEAVQADMARENDNLMDIIQPLNELGEREVKTPEVKKILEKLKEIEAKLNDTHAKLGKSRDDVDKFNDDVNRLLEDQKGKKIEEADQKLK